MTHQKYFLILKSLIVVGASVVFLKIPGLSPAYGMGDNGGIALTRANRARSINVVERTDLVPITRLEQSQAVTSTMPSQEPANSDTNLASSQISVFTTTLSSFIYLPIIFSNRPPGLNAPLLLAPAEGSSETPPVLFDWADVVNAASYQFHLSTTNAFTSLVVSETLVTSSFTLSGNLTGLYYWRVQADNASGSSPYSQVRSVWLVNYNGDEDGDSLPNGWELYGYDADKDSVIDVDLPALGASYLHKDVLIEMDYMHRDSATNGLAPSQSVINQIVTIFANAPVSNLDGVNGIKLHLELDDLVPYDPNFPWDERKVYEFYALKDKYFSSKRRAVYHYMIWANRYGGNSAEVPSTSGYSRRAPGVEFFVTLGSFNSNTGGNDIQKITAFIHELGHNLGLFHGGDDNRNYKPNYFSVMNYRWDLKGIPYNGGLKFDYQPFALPSLNEGSLNEPLGLNGGSLLAGYSTAYYCPNGTTRSVQADGSIDWNCDGDTIDTNIQVDVNKDGVVSLLYSQNDWAKIAFDGGNVIGH